MSIKKLDFRSSGIVSGFPFGKGTNFSRSSSERSPSEEQLWMRSVCDSGALTGRHSTRLDASLSRQWVLRSASSTFWSYGCCCTTPSRVDMKDRQGRRKIRWNGHLTSSFGQRRNLGSSRRKMVKVRIAGGGWALPTLDYNMPQSREQALLTNEGPSCIFVGPLEKAGKAPLEALYQQARDSYYSGSPLIVDDMFDRVETRLRWHGSKLVLKYPRCSLKRFSAYADAELCGLGGMGKQLDSSQMMALASIWSVLLATGLVAAALAPACAINKACQKSIHVHFDSHEASFMTEAMMALNGALAVGMGLLIGIPVAVAAASSLQGLWRGDLVALKGCCPNCGEEVYAFVRADQPNQPQHKTECHVCEHPLGFRAHVERSAEDPGKLWAYGRVYLLTQSKDLVPSKSSSS